MILRTLALSAAALALSAEIVAAETPVTTACDQADRRAAMADFVRLVFKERNPRAAYERYATPDLRQDNPALGHDREGAIKAIAAMFSRPGSRFEVQDVLVDGDLTAVRYRGLLDPARPGAEVVEFFRWKGPKIVEHWDVFQVASSAPPAGTKP